MVVRTAVLKMLKRKIRKKHKGNEKDFRSGQYSVSWKTNCKMEETHPKRYIKADFNK